MTIEVRIYNPETHANRAEDSYRILFDHALVWIKKPDGEGMAICREKFTSKVYGIIDKFYREEM